LKIQVNDEQIKTLKYAGPKPVETNRGAVSDFWEVIPVVSALHLKLH